MAAGAARKAMQVWYSIPKTEPPKPDPTKQEFMHRGWGVNSYDVWPGESWGPLLRPLGGTLVVKCWIRPTGSSFLSAPLCYLHRIGSILSRAFSSSLYVRCSLSSLTFTKLLYLFLITPSIKGGCLTRLVSCRYNKIITST